MILVGNSGALERLRIVSYNRRSHIDGDCDLPGIVLAHSPGKASLALRYLSPFSRIRPRF
jgi:hypothetical protein